MGVGSISESTSDFSKDGAKDGGDDIRIILPMRILFGGTDVSGVFLLDEKSAGL